MPRPILAAAIAVVALSGCATPATQAPPPGAEGSLREIGAVDIGHDHTDPALHPERAHGFRVRGALRLDERAPSPGSGLEAAQLGGRLVLAGSVLLVSTLREDVRSGFVVVDVSDPRAPRRVGAYQSEYGASEGEGLAVTTDGRFAFLSIETRYSDPPVAPAVEIVSLADGANPRLAARVPMLAQPHVLRLIEVGGKEILAVSEYHLSIAAGGLLPPSSHASAGLAFFEFSRAPPSLVPLARHVVPPGESDGIVFFHDVREVDHPSGERLVYAAAFGGGGRILSLSDPARPRELGHTLERGEAPVLRHHSFQPGSRLVDGVLPTVAVPRSRAADGAAWLSVYDTADPAHVRLLGAWRHSDPDLVPGDDPPLNLHAPAFAGDGARLLVPHFHAGLLAFDTSSRAALESPTPVAWWTPPGERVEGARFVAAVVEAVEVDGVVLATEGVSMTLWALELEA